MVDFRGVANKLSFHVVECLKTSKVYMASFVYFAQTVLDLNHSIFAKSLCFYP